MVEAYNGTGMTGGDSLAEDLNVYYEVGPSRATTSSDEC